MQAEDSHWLKKKNPKNKTKTNNRKGKKPKKKVPEVVCKNFPFTEEGLALALGDLVNSRQLP